MMYTEAELFEIIAEFDIEGRAETIKALGPGFINDTFIVSTRPDMTSGKSPRYILQRKNHNVFPDIPGMMSNIRMVTDHLRKKVIAAGGDPDREVLKVIRRKPESITDAERQSRFYRNAGASAFARRGAQGLERLQLFGGQAVAGYCE